MRVIYEEDVENCDFIEIILTRSQLKELEKEGVTKDFTRYSEGKRNLNLFIYVQED